MAIATIITRGYGSFGSIAEIITRGYDIGEAVVIVTRQNVKPRCWLRQTR
jgi:hypothetical protein